VSESTQTHCRHYPKIDQVDRPPSPGVPCSRSRSSHAATPCSDLACGVSLSTYGRPCLPGGAAGPGLATASLCAVVTAGWPAFGVRRRQRRAEGASKTLGRPCGRAGGTRQASWRWRYESRCEPPGRNHRAYPNSAYLGPPAALKRPPHRQRKIGRYRGLTNGSKRGYDPRAFEHRSVSAAKDG
jgi:hypothetical protein